MGKYSKTICDKKGRVTDFLIGISPPDVECSIEDPFKRVFKIPDTSGMSQEELKAEVTRLWKKFNETDVLEPASYVIPGVNPNTDEVWYPDNSNSVYKPWKNIKFRFIMWMDKILNKLKK